MRQAFKLPFLNFCSCPLNSVSQLFNGCFQPVGSAWDYSCSCTSQSLLESLDLPYSGSLIGGKNESQGSGTKVLSKRLTFFAFRVKLAKKSYCFYSYLWKGQASSKRRFLGNDTFFLELRDSVYPLDIWGRVAGWSQRSMASEMALLFMNKYQIQSQAGSNSLYSYYLNSYLLGDGDQCSDLLAEKEMDLLDGSGGWSIYLLLLVGKDPLPRSAVMMSPFCLMYYLMQNQKSSTRVRFLGQKWGQNRLHLLMNSCLRMPGFQEGAQPLTQRTDRRCRQSKMGLSTATSQSMNTWRKKLRSSHFRMDSSRPMSLRKDSGVSLAAKIMLASREAAVSSESSSDLYVRQKCSSYTIPNDPVPSRSITLNSSRIQFREKQGYLTRMWVCSRLRVKTELCPSGLVSRKLSIRSDSYSPFLVSTSIILFPSCAVIFQNSLKMSLAMGLQLLLQLSIWRTEERLIAMQAWAACRLYSLYLSSSPSWNRWLYIPQISQSLRVFDRA